MSIKEMTKISIFSALIAVCSWISIPFSVPFTLQTFAIFLCLKQLGGKKGTLSIIIYILLGAVGLPVFAGFKGGMHNLFGLTGGYILGFLFIGLIYIIFEKDSENSNLRYISAMIIGLVVCYIFGTIWFIKIYSSTKGSYELLTVLQWTVIPFIIPDLLKMSLALYVSKSISKAYKMI